MTRKATGNGAWVVNPTAKTALRYAVRRRKAPFERGEVTSLAEAAALVSLLERHERGATPDEQAAWLKGLPPQIVKWLVTRGLLVHERDVPERVFFDAPLGNADGKLVPRALRARVRKNELLIVSKGVALQSGPTVPPLVAKGTDPLETPIPRVWVRHPGTQMVFPYRSSSGQVAWLRRRTEELDAETTRAFVHAQVLVPKGWDADEALRWQHVEAEARTQLARKGYAVLPGLVPPLFLASMRRYYRALAREGYLELDTTQVVDKRTSLHDERVLRYVHAQSVPLLRAVTGENLKPSYSLVARYLPGAVLERHVDRPQCAWNVSLAIDAEPETDTTTSWPIYLRAHGRTGRVRLGLGDGLVYRGTEVPHWREELRGSRSVTMGLLHFVAATFRGALV